MRKAERFGRILELLAGDGSVAVGDLARDLGVSEATIRRDLRALDEQRLLARSHGGAVAQGTLYELPVRYRTGRQREEKRQIARAARDRVPDGSVVALTGGTTTTEVARAISDREGLTMAPGRRLDFFDPWGNRFEVVAFADIQFDRVPGVKRKLGIEDLEKTDKARAEIRERGLSA